MNPGFKKIYFRKSEHLDFQVNCDVRMSDSDKEQPVRKLKIKLQVKYKD